MSDGLTYPAPQVIGEYKTLQEGDVVRIVIAECGIDADYRVVCEPGAAAHGGTSYALQPVRLDEQS